MLLKISSKIYESMVCGLHGSLWVLCAPWFYLAAGTSHSTWGPSRIRASRCSSGGSSEVTVICRCLAAFLSFLLVVEFGDDPWKWRQKWQLPRRFMRLAEVSGVVYEQIGCREMEMVFIDAYRLFARNMISFHLHAWLPQMRCVNDYRILFRQTLV